MTKTVSSVRTVGAFLNGRACSDTALYILNRAFGESMTTEERAIMPMAGGIMQHGYQCGLVWGATLAAGAEAYRRFGPGARAEVRAISAGSRLVASFRRRNDALDCYDITHLNNSSSKLQMVSYFVVRGGTIGCFRRAGSYAPMAFEQIDQSLSEKNGDGLVLPVSCTALLARRTGFSEKHATMASGLAGGIGLCGGACGALGTAIWLLAMKRLRNGAKKVDYNDPQFANVVEAFLNASDFEFECSKVSGRMFGDVAEHAAFVLDGGCSKVLDALTEVVSG
jgi:Putative redox-active protein (C_GCAxxG_C_C)